MTTANFFMWVFQSLSWDFPLLITPPSTISLVYDSSSMSFSDCVHIPKSLGWGIGLWFCPTQPCTTFFFLPTSFNSQALLFPTRRNLKLKSMGKQQSNSSCAKNWGCCQAVLQAPYAEIRLAPMRPHMLDIPICFCSLFSPLKKPLPKPASNANPIHS